MPIAPGTIAYYPLLDSSPADVSGNGFDLVPVTTLTYDATKGVKADGKRAEPPAGLMAALAGLTTYTLEFYFEPYGTSGNAWFCLNVAETFGVNMYNANASAQPFWKVGAPSLSFDILGLTGLHTLGFTVSGTAKKVYLDNALVASDANGVAFPTVSDMGIFAHTSGAYSPSYFKGVRFSDVARTSFPTVDLPDSIDDRRRRGRS